MRQRGKTKKLMPDLIDIIFSSSEVLALLIPLMIFVFYKPDRTKMRYIIAYTITAFVLNLITFLLYVYHSYLPSYLQNNNILYNLSSLIRVLFFGLYIYHIKPYRFQIVHKIVFAAYFIYALVNFTFIQSPFFLSNTFLAAESIVLLIFCLFFFLSFMQDDSETNWLRQPSFLICIGICLYECVIFFIFLFFYALSQKNPSFGVITLYIYYSVFIILCILLGLALYRSRKNNNETSLNK